jgi:hypothetical protein
MMTYFFWPYKTDFTRFANFFVPNYCISQVRTMFDVCSVKSMRFCPPMKETILFLMNTELIYNELILNICTNAYCFAIPGASTSK